MQDGGTDWRTIRVLDVASGKETSDKVEWAKFTMGAAWMKDGSGFFYARYPEPPADAKFQALNENHRIYFHRLGTAQSEDRLVYETPDKPGLSHYPGVTDDGRWLVVTTTEGTDDRYEISVIDLRDPAWKPRRIFAGLENQWGAIGNVGSVFYWTTNRGAPRGRIVSLDVAAEKVGPEAVREIVPESAATLDGASLIGGAADPRLSGRCAHRGPPLHARRQGGRHHRLSGDRHGVGLRRRAGRSRDLLRLHQLQLSDDDLPL